ncbi:MAG: transposase [Bacteroidaceae bacterium]|nr:transposase [Bacteroidaceae bacterium]
MAILGLTKELYFTTSTVVDWMDVFTRPVYKHIIIDSLKYCQEHKGLEIYAWVLMTNHLHMIVGLDNVQTNSQSPSQIGDVLRDFKKFTSKGIVKAIEQNQQESRKEWLIDRCSFRGANDCKVKNYKFWQDGSYLETIHSYDFYKEKLNYIHMNPVRQEIVERPEDYLYSSARNYSGMQGMINVKVQL